MTPDLVLTDARVLTMDAETPRAEALALSGGTIAAVGSRREIEALAGPRTDVIGCGGATVLPGFVESHLHLVLGGAELAHLQLRGVEDEAALTRAFRAFAAANPDRALLMAQGGYHTMIGRPLTRQLLDAIIPDRPIAITAMDHHTVWANTAALRQAGLLHGAAMPHGHEVVLGPDGTATGELREFEAFAPVIAIGGEARLNLGIATGGEPSPWPDAAAQAIDRAKVLRGLRHCAAHGITSMVNMDGNLYTLRLLDGLRREGNLLARVKVPFHFKPHMDLSELARAEAMTAEYDDDWLSCRFVKMFMDGVIDSRTAFLLADYADQPGWRSVPLFPPERFRAIATEIDRRGLQMAVHCVGDGAVRAVIDGYEAARRANGPRDSRHRIEHIEQIDPADVPRLAANAIVASLQPGHAPGAGDFPLHPWAGTVGRDRLRGAFLHRSLAEAGVRLAYASDWPVIGVSVIDGIRAALNRAPYDGPGCRDERIGLMATLHAYTAGGAWAAFAERLTGRLVPGMAADVAVLSGDIEATPPERIGTLSVALTVAGGRITHRAQDAAAPAAAPSPAPAGR